VDVERTSHVMPGAHIVLPRHLSTPKDFAIRQTSRCPRPLFSPANIFKSGCQTLANSSTCSKNGLPPFSVKARQLRRQHTKHPQIRRRNILPPRHHLKRSTPKPDNAHLLAALSLPHLTRFIAHLRHRPLPRHQVVFLLPESSIERRQWAMGS
jgi:hypothetical protein